MKINVTGYIDTEDLEPDQVDLSHSMGLSTKGYEEISRDLAYAGLADFELELER